MAPSSCVAIVWMPLNKSSQKSFLNKIKAPEAHALQEPFLLFTFLLFMSQKVTGPWPMQLVVPSAVRAAVRMLTIT
jgi:hypothetical protein